MNLLFIDLHCDALLPSGAGEFGGGNTYSRSVLSLISKYPEINCIYVTRKKSKSLTDSFKFSENIKFFRIKIGDFSYNDKDSLFKHTETSIAKVFELLKKMKFVPEIIHSSYWPSGLVALEIVKKYNAKHVHTVLSNGRRKAIQSGNYEIEQIRTSSEQRIYDNSDFIICSSKAELEDINKLYNVSKQKLVLTGLDVDDAYRFPSYWKNGSFLSNNSKDADEKNYLNITKSCDDIPDDISWWNDGAFLYFGRLHEDKGIVQIINCWLELYNKNHMFASLWIAGGTPEQIDYFRKIIDDKKTLNFAERNGKIIWWGRISPEGISTLLLKSIAVITHSRYESGGLMILESLASAKPIVASPNGFAKDCVKNWENGFIVNYNDSNSLKLRMIHFYMQPLLTSILGNNALKKFYEVDKEYNFRNKHLELYNIKKISVVQYKRRTIMPYPLCEEIPSEAKIKRCFYNVYSKENIINYRDISINSLFDNEFHSIWSLNVNEKIFYCIRWKNHYNNETIFYKTTKDFYTSFEQYNTNKMFLEMNSKREKYFDDFYRLIFINSSNVKLEPLSNNVSLIVSKKYIFKNKISKYTQKNIIHEIKNMLYNYDFFFSNCYDIINTLIENISNNKLDHTELHILPKKIENTYILGDDLVFVNELIKVEKEYIYFIKGKEKCKNFDILMKCHKLMKNSIIDGRIDKDSFIRLLNDLK